MLVNSHSIVCGTAILSLFMIDFLLGHGFFDTVQRTSCRLVCFVKRIVREESKVMQTEPEIPINFPVLVVEILLLSLIIAFLNKYKHQHNQDTIDELLKKSREALRQSNEFLDKWRSKQNIGDGNSQTGRQDAGDTVEISDTAVLSVTSLVSDDFDIKSVDEPILDEIISEETKHIEFRNRYLWDVVEEDANSLDE